MNNSVLISRRKPQSPADGNVTIIGLAACAVGLALVLSGCAQPTLQTPATQYERGVLMQRVDAAMAAAAQPGTLKLEVSPEPLVTGKNLSLAVSNSVAGYLYVFQVATDGRTLSLVFPNEVDGANYIAPGVTQLPRANWQLRAHGPAGTGYMLAVRAAQPLNAMAVQSEANQGRISLPEGYAASLATLREVAP